MAEIGKHKLSDAVPHPRPQADANADKGGRPLTTHETGAEQAREASENEEARGKASNRERMVDIGRGNQQAGRQGS